MIMPQEMTGARTQAVIVTVGLFTFVSVGLAACLALVAGLFYLVVNLVLLLLSGTVEGFNGLAATWSAADPLLKILILAGVAYGVYRLYRRKGGFRLWKHL